MKALLNLVSTAASFLTNQPPPGVDALEAERLKSVNHLESKKFFIVITSVVILIFFLFAGTAILFFLPRMPEIVTGYITLFSKTTEILAVVIAFYVSAQAVVDLKYGSSSSAAVSAQSQTTEATTSTTTTENINETLTVIHTNAKDEDYELE